MNIPDKPQLFSEIRRVLRPGGRLALYDILAGPGEAPIYPAPWAADESLSFLIPPGELRRLLQETGFQVVSWRDTTQVGAERTGALIERLRQADGSRGPGIHLLMGENWETVAENVRRNAQEQRIVVMEVIAECL